MDQRVVRRAATGITGLDDVLCGGFATDRMYLVEGSPGVGKTTLAMQFLIEGVRRGERALYVTLSETRWSPSRTSHRPSQKSRRWCSGASHAARAVPASTSARRSGGRRIIGP